MGQIQSLKRRESELAKAQEQVRILDDYQSAGVASFQSKLAEQGLWPLRATQLDTFQVNVGKMCNQVCKHCHVDAGPDRKEIMTRQTMDEVLAAVERAQPRCVDLTGGAPEMNPDFRYFVEKLSAAGVEEIIVRCNLTIILANPKYHDLPEFFRKYGIHVVSSLPYFNASRTDAQRGDGVFDKSIEALKRLNEVGYGKEGTGLVLDLVYNPAGAFLPDDQQGLELQFKQKLSQGWGIEFNELLAITNLPVSRFLDYLIKTDQYESYLQELVAAYNPVAAEGVMCRGMISIGWDGQLYDCDFNQMLEMPLAGPGHIRDFDLASLEGRPIATSQHCFGCTAGAGSSCGGATT